jgi:hypothetical protein
MLEECFSVSTASELLAISSRSFIREFFFGSSFSRWIFNDEFLRRHTS